MSLKTTAAKALVIYSIPNHPAAVEARDFCRKHGIQFDERDVTASAAFAEHLMRASGQNTLPLLEFGKQTSVGFNAGVKRKLSVEFKFAD